MRGERDPKHSPILFLEYLACTDRAVGQLASEMSHSLFCSAGLRGPYIFFEVHNVINKSRRLLPVRLKRSVFSYRVYQVIYCSVAVHPQTELRTINIGYHTVSMGQEFRRDLAGWLGFKCWPVLVLLRQLAYMLSRGYRFLAHGALSLGPLQYV